jgi:hypothetical protein
MASFYCDEDVRIEVAALLIQAGHHAWTTVGEQRLSAWDSDQLRYASAHGWMLITHNRRDFHTLHDVWLQWSPFWREQRAHGGMLILDQGYPAQITLAAIQTLLTMAPPSLAGQAYDWFARDGGIWRQWRS